MLFLSPRRRYCLTLSVATYCTTTLCRPLLVAGFPLFKSEVRRLGTEEKKRVFSPALSRERNRRRNTLFLLSVFFAEAASSYAGNIIISILSLSFPETAFAETSQVHSGGFGTVFCRFLTTALSVSNGFLRAHSRIFHRVISFTFRVISSI